MAGYQLRWQTDYEAVKAQRDALAKEYAELYPLLTARLCDLFHRVEALDQECSRINGEAPAGDRRRLLGVELTARKLAGLSTGSPFIAKALKLPDFDHSDRMAWPSLQPSLAASYAMSMMAPFLAGKVTCCRGARSGFGAFRKCTAGVFGDFRRD